MSKILIINGPNLNLLGEREQSQYGKKDYKFLEEICLNRAKELKIDLEIKQSNVEGEIVNMIQDSRNSKDGIIRCHIPIITNDNVYFNIDNKNYNLEAGNLYYINVGEKEHYVKNNSTEYNVDFYNESPYFYENNKLHDMMKTLAWLTYTNEEKKNILDNELDEYFSQ